MKKRILTLLTVIAILAGIAVPARAEETVQEEAVECLTEMPYEALPEEEFEFDEASRTITAYIGTSVDVIIPRTIGGVAVENISYNAFECDVYKRQLLLSISCFAFYPVMREKY